MLENCFSPILNPNKILYFTIEISKLFSAVRGMSILADILFWHWQSFPIKGRHFRLCGALGLLQFLNSVVQKPSWTIPEQMGVA